MLRQLNRSKPSHFNTQNKNTNGFSLIIYRQLRNHVNNQIKLAKSKFFQDKVITNKDKPSELWKTLNDLTSRNKSDTSPSCIISEDKVNTDQKSMATILNEYFTSIGTKLADNIKSTLQSNQHPPSTELPFSFVFEEVDDTFVHQELSSLKTNKATGLDQISAKLLKDSASTIASSLTRIFNASLALQTFPDIWKGKNHPPLQMQRSNSTKQLQTYHYFTYLKQNYGAHCSQTNVQVSTGTQSYRLGAVWFSPIFIHKCCIDACHGGNSKQYGQQIKYRCGFH